MKNAAGRKRLWLGEGLIGLLLVMSFSVRLHAQAAATLSGTITDASGAVVPKAEVSIRNVSTGVVRTVSVDASGLYAAPNLLPGDYVVTASAAGFAAESTNLTLTVGAEQVLNLSLRVGNVAETVVVSDVAPTVDLASAALGGLDNQTTIVELPLNARSWTDLANLQPGVSPIHTQALLTAGDRTNRGFGTQISISGSRPQDNNYLLNGVSIEDHSNGGPGSVLGGNMGVDAISEFSVLTSGFSVEYGRAAGGIINAITKSGTNSLHGSAYEFIRNSALDARNYFDLPTIPPFRRNQFGASAGAPIRKDKTFIFGDYEGLRQFLSVSQVDTVPSAAARAGNLTEGTVTVNPEATRFMNAFYPLPNGQVFGDTGFYQIALPQITSEDYFTFRLDHKLTSKDTVSVIYFRDTSSTDQPDEFDNKSSFTVVNKMDLALDETHVFSSTTTNDLRLAFNRFVEGVPLSQTAVNPAIDNPSFGAEPGLNAPQIRFGSSGIATEFSGGLGGLDSSHFNTYQVYDDVTYTKGLHGIKFGANVERDQDNISQGTGSTGLFQFNTLSDFLTNVPSSAQLPSPAVAPAKRVSVFGAYIEDNWHFRPSLTINMGLRWEMSTVPSEVYGHVTNLINITDANPFEGNPLFRNNTNRDFEPRIGFAWDPFRTGKTSVRGAFGIYDVLNLLYGFTNSFTVDYPFINEVVANTPPPGSFPNGATVAYTNPDDKHVEHVDFNPGRNYVMEWNLSVQRELTPSLTATLGYVGSRGLHGTINHDDANIVLPTVTPVGYLWPCEAPGLPFVPAGTTPPAGLNPGCNGIGTGQRLNPDVGRLGAAFFDNSTFYDGMQFQLTKKMSHGFQVQGSFTWQRSIDIASGSVAGDTYISGITSGFDLINPKLMRGPSDFDVPRVLTLSYVWDVPTPKSFTQLMRTALGGWEVGGIWTASDGSPFTPILAGDPVGLDSTDAVDFPDRLSGPGCSSPVNPGNVNDYIKLQCFGLPPAVMYNGVPYLRLGEGGRNEVYGPGLQNFDFSLMKNTDIPRISEAFKVQFRAEFFNILNHSNFQAPIDNATIFDPSIPGFGISPANIASAVVSGAGAIDRTTTTSRQIQFGLKLIW